LKVSLLLHYLVSLRRGPAPRVVDHLVGGAEISGDADVSTAGTLVIVIEWTDEK
jgi:hypothetical protein